MTALLSIGAWFLKNPVWLLVAGLGAALLGVSVDDGLHRIELSSCREARATEKAAAEKAKSDALAEAQAKSDAIITEQAERLAGIAQRSDAVKERIIRVPVTSNCSGSPAVHDALGSLPGILNTSGGQAKAGSGAAAAVRRP